MNTEHSISKIEDIDSNPKQDYTLKPIHLTNAQIIGLMEVCFPLEFSFDPTIERARLTLFVKENTETSYGFDFWIETKVNNIECNYKGAIFGDGDVLISKGASEDEKYGIHDSWDNHFTIPIKAVFEYLQEIHFFEIQDKEPLINPLLKQETWQQIYLKDFGE